MAKTGFRTYIRLIMAAERKSVLVKFPPADWAIVEAHALTTGLSKTDVILDMIRRGSDAGEKPARPDPKPAPRRSATVVSRPALPATASLPSAPGVRIQVGYGARTPGSMLIAKGYRRPKAGAPA
jgi:hypothetical protein